jgi:60 kDa SS-A/Ro ribonucleoprotein
LKDPAVWEALLQKMPLTATIRNLGVMTARGVFRKQENIDLVVKKLSDEAYLKKSRIHPMTVLTAMKTYAMGKSVAGHTHGRANALTWIPMESIVKALDSAFYKCFGNVVPTNKRTLVALDVSGSMQHDVMGYPNMSAYEAGTAMAMIQAATEPEFSIIGFSSESSFSYARRGKDTGLHEIPLAPGQSLERALQYVTSIRGGGTDVSLSVRYALDQFLSKGIVYDTLIVYTDSETWAGDTHFYQALSQYRNKVNPNLKVVLAATAPNNVKLSEPQDSKTLSVVGFDSGLPETISWFVTQGK